jgi:hypothetical protein
VLTLLGGDKTFGGEQKLLHGALEGLFTFAGHFDDDAVILESFHDLQQRQEVSTKAADLERNDAMNPPGTNIGHHSLKRRSIRCLAGDAIIDVFNDLRLRVPPLRDPTGDPVALTLDLLPV